jgi:predicted nucleic acid-binding protein
VLLTNDNRARQAATDLGVKVFNVPTFLLACKMSGLTNREQMAELVRGLEERDRYGFRKDVRELLLA